MVWVVNANMKKDANGHFKFFKQNPAIRDHVYDIIEPSAYFPAGFSRSIAPVIFDYSDCNDIAECDRNNILCLLPKIRGNISRVIQIRKSTFINSVSKGVFFNWVEKHLHKLDEEYVNFTDTFEEERKKYIGM